MTDEEKAIVERRTPTVNAILHKPNEAQTVVVDPLHALTETHQGKRATRSDAGKPRAKAAEKPFMVGASYVKFDVTQPAGRECFLDWIDEADLDERRLALIEIIEEINRLRAIIQKREG